MRGVRGLGKAGLGFPEPFLGAQWGVDSAWIQRGFVVDSAWIRRGFARKTWIQVFLDPLATVFCTRERGRTWPF